MDTQHIQGEGVPSQTGEGQSHHRPDQWYLSLQPTHSLPLPFPKDYKTGSWEMDQPAEKEPLESGWPAHCRGFFLYQRRLLKKIKNKKRYRVSVERCTHVPSEPKTPADRSRGGEGPWGGLDLPGRCLYHKTVAEKLPELHASAFTTSNTWASHELIVRGVAC